MADIYASNWDETDASNTTAAPDGMPEGMSPSGVNNWGRAVAGAFKRYVNQQIPKTTGGTTTAYTLSYGVTPGALVDGMTHLVLFNAANGLAPTLNVNALGATPLHYYSAGAWRAIPTGLIGINQVFLVVYNSSAGAYRVMRPRDDTGVVEAFAGTTAPAGTLLCYGQAISRTDYVGLFTALSTTYGVGNGTTTFNLPDIRDRAVAGLGNMGGSGASRLTTASLTASNTLGATGGIETKASDTNSGGGTGRQGGADSVAQDGHVHNTVVVQPTIILNYIIRI